MKTVFNSITLLKTGIAMMRTETSHGVLNVSVIGKQISVWLKGVKIGTGELACADSLKEIMTGGVRWHLGESFRSFNCPARNNSISQKCLTLIDSAHRMILGRRKACMLNKNVQHGCQRENQKNLIEV